MPVCVTEGSGVACCSILPLVTWGRPEEVCTQARIVLGLENEVCYQSTTAQSNWRHVLGTYLVRNAHRDIMPMTSTHPPETVTL